MLVISLIFAAYVISSGWYIRKLHKQLHSYEVDWDHIKNLTDHNKDGDVIIHARHLGEP